MSRLGAVTMGLFLFVMFSGSLRGDPHFRGDAEVKQPERAAGEARYWLLAGRDGKIWAVRDYWVEGETLRYVFRDGAQGSLPLGQLDELFTRQLNQERGEEFLLPKAVATPPRPAAELDLGRLTGPGKVSTGVTNEPAQADCAYRKFRTE